MDPFLENPCEEIDACIFSGDRLHDKENRAAFRLYLERWTRELKLIDQLDIEEPEL